MMPLTLAFPSFSLDRGEAMMDAGNKREGQRAKGKEKRQNADTENRWLGRERETEDAKKGE